jgi:hypothetical protein
MARTSALWKLCSLWAHPFKSTGRFNAKTSSNEPAKTQFLLRSKPKCRASLWKTSLKVIRLTTASPISVSQRKHSKKSSKKRTSVATRWWQSSVKKTRKTTHFLDSFHLKRVA